MSTHTARKARHARDNVLEIIGGGDDEYLRVLRELDEIDWGGVSVRSVLEVAPKLYANFRRALFHREDVAR